MMKNVRMSRKVHEVPRLANELIDMAGFRGVGYGSDSGITAQPTVPKKERAFKHFPNTPAPGTDESSPGHEGPHSTQAARKTRKR